MALTAKQRQVAGRYDLGGDALEALVPTALKSEVIEITNSPATLKSLLAAEAFESGVKRVSLKADGAWSFAIGEDAEMGDVSFDANVLYEIGCTADTDLRVIAGSASVKCRVVQEG